MVELFLTFLGRYSRMFIDWYVRNTLLLSSIVVCYGVLLIFAKNNLYRVEKRLEDIFGVTGSREIAEKLKERPLDASQIAALKAGFVLPIIISGNYIFFRFISNKSLMRIFLARSRQRINLGQDQ